MELMTLVIISSESQRKRFMLNKKNVVVFWDDDFSEKIIDFDGQVRLFDPLGEKDRMPSSLIACEEVKILSIPSTLVGLLASCSFLGSLNWLQVERAGGTKVIDFTKFDTFSNLKTVIIDDGLKVVFKYSSFPRLENFDFSLVNKDQLLELFKFNELNSLAISKVKKFEIIEDLLNNLSITELVIKSSNITKLFKVCDVNLKSLKFIDMPKLESITEFTESIPALKSVTTSYCKHLK